MEISFSYWLVRWYWWVNHPCLIGTFQILCLTPHLSWFVAASRPIISILCPAGRRSIFYGFNIPILVDSCIPLQGVVEIPVLLYTIICVYIYIYIHIYIYTYAYRYQQLGLDIIRYTSPIVLIPYMCFMYTQVPLLKHPFLIVHAGGCGVIAELTGMHWQPYKGGSILPCWGIQINAWWDLSWVCSVDVLWVMVFWLYFHWCDIFWHRLL